MFFQRLFKITLNPNLCHPILLSIQVDAIITPGLRYRKQLVLVRC